VNVGNGFIPIHNPQSFLNEAALTRTALSIRLGALLTRLAQSDWKILVLDDMLISLDMSNRMLVSKIILNDIEFQGFQKIILTHDKAFYNILKSQTDSSEWKYLEFHKNENVLGSKPRVYENQTYLEKAAYYTNLGEFEIAGNLLRKEAEEFCKRFLPKKYHYTPDYTLYDLNGLLNQCVSFAESAGLDAHLFRELDTFRKHVLNPSSHDSYDVPKFESEVQACLNTLEKLKLIKSEPILFKGDKIEFELQSGSSCQVEKQGLYRFEIVVQEELRLIKEENKNSCISKGMLNFKIYHNHQLLPAKKSSDEYNHETVLLKNFYDNLYGKSDKSKSGCFWDEIKISDNGNNLRSLKVF
jgi:hypothetical protein